MLRKNLNLFCYLLVGIIGLLGLSSVSSEEPSSYCYAIDDLGSVDLTELCIKTPRNTNHRGEQKLSVTDRDFIQAYKQEINELPAIRDNILAKLDRSPISEVNRAKSICQQTKDNLKQQSEPSKDANVERVLEKLARQFYCPEKIVNS